MPNVKTTAIRTAAIAAFIGSLALAAPSYAAPADPGSQAAARRVETRIQTLHDKLGVTDTEEAKWSDVAQAMRENETNMHQLIQERHQNPASMTAVDDLQSYQKIAQAHVDGLQKLTPAFQALYDDMPDAQKVKADRVFSSFEGHAAAAKKRSNL